MNSIGTLLSSIVTAIGARLFQHAEPFILEEAKALAAMLETELSVALDSTLSVEEKHELHQTALDGLKTLAAAAEQKSKELAGDILTIIAQAGSDEVLSAIGLRKSPESK